MSNDRVARSHVLGSLGTVKGGRWEALGTVGRFEGRGKRPT